MEKIVICPHCGRGFSQYANPTPTTDMIIYAPVRGVAMIERMNQPPGFALPGGFIEEGEQIEEAAVREMREKTGLDVELTGLLDVYSRPDRDPRQHTLSVVFTGTPWNPDQLRVGDDAKGAAAFYPLGALPASLAFDHARILRDFKAVLAGKLQAAAVDQTAALHRYQPQPLVVDYE